MTTKLTKRATKFQTATRNRRLFIRQRILNDINIYMFFQNVKMSHNKGMGLNETPKNVQVGMDLSHEWNLQWTFSNLFWWIYCWSRMFLR